MASGPTKAIRPPLPEALTGDGFSIPAQARHHARKPGEPSRAVARVGADPVGSLLQLSSPPFES